MEPLRIEVTRGARIEAVHHVAAAVVDATGRVVFAAGDADAAHYPRSAIKAMLALPLLVSGIADRFGLDDRALTLICASHAGEPSHVAVARDILAASGRDESALACGAHWPLSRAAANALARDGSVPRCVHNNCSGKHAGLICAAAGLGVEHDGYEQPEHPAMRAATEALSLLTGIACDDRNRAIDGCSIPTYAIPLAATARGFAVLATGRGLGADHAAACLRLRRAVARHPELLAGSGRFDTTIALAFGEAIFIKGGAEGVWCAGLPSLGLGLAVKALDGAGRAAQAAIAVLLSRMLGPHPALDEASHPRVSNWRGVPVGHIRLGAA